MIIHPLAFVPRPGSRARTRNGRTLRHGFTLNEMVITLPLMAMLMLGLGSAIKLASSSVPNGTSVSDTTLTGAKALDLFSADLAFATSITSNVTGSSAGRQVTFVIPDRDGLAPTTETVTYSWSGINGDPLLRTFNGSVQTVATNIQEFALAYDKRVKQVDTTSSVTSSEQLLINADGTTTPFDSTITSSNWCAQYFQPLLPKGATAWNVTKVQFLAKTRGGATGQTFVELRPAVGRLPASTALAQQVLLESTLTNSYTLCTILFSGVPAQSPGLGLTLVMKYGSGSQPGDVQCWAGGKSNNYYLSTSNAEGSWTAGTSNSLRLYVYGTITTPSTTTANVYSLTNVRATLRAGSSTLSRLSTSVRTPNEPQVAGP